MEQSCGKVVDIIAVRRVFRRTADGLFAWTVLQRLRGDDGRREVASQSRPVLTGVNVSPSSHPWLSCVEMHMFHSCRERMCIKYTLMVGWWDYPLKDEALHRFSESVSAVDPQSHTDPA